MKQNISDSPTKLIVITGAPGAGKTATFEMIRKILSEKSVIMPSAAYIVFCGGFWRLPSTSAKVAAQRAIFYVQREIENLVLNEKKWSIGLCDKGSLDGLAYWPGEEADFWELAQSTMDEEFNRYYAVIHMRTPNEECSDNPGDKQIDEKMETIWKNHPRYHAVFCHENFMTKAQTVIELIMKYQLILEGFQVEENLKINDQEINPQAH